MRKRALRDSPRPPAIAFGDASYVAYSGDIESLAYGSYVSGRAVSAMIAALHADHWIRWSRGHAAAAGAGSRDTSSAPLLVKSGASRFARVCVFPPSSPPPGLGTGRPRTSRVWSAAHVINLRHVDIVVWVLHHDFHYVVIAMDLRARVVRLFDSIKDYVKPWRREAVVAVKAWVRDVAEMQGLPAAEYAHWTVIEHDDGVCMPRQHGGTIGSCGVDCALMALAVCAFILRGERWVGSSGSLLFTQASMPSFRRQAVHLLQNAGGQRFGNVPRRPPCVRTHPHTRTWQVVSLHVRPRRPGRCRLSGPCSFCAVGPRTALAYECVTTRRGVRTRVELDGSGPVVCG